MTSRKAFSDSDLLFSADERRAVVAPLAKKDAKREQALTAHRKG
jgi:hypothetical protein